MKTIEIISGEQKAQFTTKSVTLDGKEFLYINMSNVHNNTDDCVYTFTYDNETKTLPYKADDAKILNAIFSQVQNLETKKKLSQTVESTSVSPDKKTAQIISESTEYEPDKETASQPVSETEESTLSENSDEDTNPKNGETSEQINEPAVDEKAAKKAEKARLKEEKRKEKERKKAEKAEKKASDKSETEKTEKFALVETPDNNDSQDESSDEETSDKKTRLKKSIIVFVIIVAAIAVLSLIYFFIFGTSDEPSPINQSSTDSQTYDDIDELINDLQ